MSSKLDELKKEFEHLLSDTEFVEFAEQRLGNNGSKVNEDEYASNLGTNSHSTKEAYEQLCKSLSEGK